MENGCGEGDSPPGSCLPGGAAQNPECAWRRQAERLGEVGVSACRDSPPVAAGGHSARPGKGSSLLIA